MDAEHIGVVSLKLCSGHVLNSNIIIYVPSMRRNLISISVLDDCGYFFNFSNKRVTLSCDFIIVGFGVLCDGLYTLDVHAISNLEKNLIVNFVVGNKCGRIFENSYMLLHKRLGHISEERIKRLEKKSCMI